MENISKGSQDQTGAKTLNYDKASRTLKNQLLRLNSICHLSCQYCLFGVRAERWLGIWRSELKPLKTSAVLQEDTWRIVQTANTRQNNNLTMDDYHHRMSWYLTVKIYRRKLPWFGHVSAAALRCRKPNDAERWTMVVAKEDPVNYWRTTSKSRHTMQSMSSLLRIADTCSRYASITTDF